MFAGLSVETGPVTSGRFSGLSQKRLKQLRLRSDEEISRGGTEGTKAEQRKNSILKEGEKLWAGTIMIR